MKLLKTNKRNKQLTSLKHQLKENEQFEILSNVTLVQKSTLFESRWRIHRIIYEDFHRNCFILLPTVIK